MYVDVIACHALQPGATAILRDVMRDTLICSSMKEGVGDVMSLEQIGG